LQYYTTSSASSATTTTMATKALPWNIRNHSTKYVECLESAVILTSNEAQNNNRADDAKPAIRTPDLEICMEDRDSTSALTTTQDEQYNTASAPGSRHGLSNAQFSLKVDLPAMDQIPCSCCFFLGYETCCAIYSGIGCISFVVAITCLCLYLSGSLSGYS
jgi:hypothetical protein